ncbi:ribosome silencing factor [Sphingomonas paeninsulae]|jgi:ribosome-associated protein|uniref:Ribosomal silencing factor RsfS n=2 Tax=Sphingomonas paeninsulae TaxID=2319844 RepID=A0A494TGG2_SPHPE|nr:ribosome silencing factor [Sphingomonas paeninsulae]
MVSPFFNPIHGTAHTAFSLTKGPSLPAAAISQPPSPTESPKDSVDALHAMILEQLDSDQAVETISIPLEGKSSIADHMVIASGRSTRQVASMAAKIAQRMKTEFKRSPRIEGLPAADWVLIDAGDVIVHLFRPEVRSFYNLERMWSLTDAPIVAGPAF